MVFRGLMWQRSRRRVARMGPYLGQCHDHLQHLGRDEIGGRVGDEVDKRPISALQIGLQQGALDSRAVGQCERFSALFC